MTIDINHFLAHSLVALFSSLGRPALISSWLCSDIEAYGENAEELLVYSEKQQPIEGQELFNMVSRLDCIADGYFRAYHHTEIKPWLVVRVIDNNVFEIESHDPVVAQIKQKQSKKSSGRSAKKQSKKGVWGPVAFAKEMRESTSSVSAFFLIDSQESVSRCVQWLSLLKPFNLPNMEDSKYFNEVREIYETGKEVVNFDYNFKLYWENKELQALLRCHFIEKGRYQIELWLPGIIANNIADNFKDGREGFFCAFMPPLFYD